jgi:hypothetical protein
VAETTGDGGGKTLVFLLGPPAVGKMTVGRELSRRTGLPLFHNHLSIEAVLPVFDYGHPAFDRLVSLLRRETFAEVARSELPGVIFTFVWDFDAPDELDYVRELVGPFERAGGRVVYVELWADLATRLARNATPERLREKPSKRDVESSRARLISSDHQWRTHSDGRFPLAPHLLIDTTRLAATTVAERIVAHFGLSSVTARGA